MSAFLLGIGFRADMGTCARKLVLLKLIDACEDDGSRIFPAISTIARAAQCSTRQVQRELQAFREIGLIRLVREGGKGPRSTNEYALDLDLLTRLGKDGWSMVTGAPADDKGDTVSPLDDDEKGDTGDAVRVTPATDKGDIACHPTPPDPSLDPSIEREARAGERENQKSVERWLKRVHPKWPSFVSDSGKEALKAALGLTEGEREQAAARMADYIAVEKQNGGKCAISVYLAEKRWERLPTPNANKSADLEAPAFGPLFMAFRQRALFGPITPPPPPMSQFLRDLVARDDSAGRAERMRRQAHYGFPTVNRMHELAASGRAVRVAPEWGWLRDLMEKVPVGSERFEEWKLEHELRGWPWIPDPGQQPVVYFPKGGPAGLSEFEAAIKRGGHDGGERQAAE